jgi:hypothetical protein
MNKLIEILIPLVSTIFEQVSTFLSSLADAAALPAGAGSVTIAIAAGTLAYIPEGVLSVIRRWHSNTDNQYSNIDNLVNLITANQPAWVIPADLLAQLTANRNRLQTLIGKCRSVSGSTADRAERNTLLKSTVKLCLVQVRIWAYGKYADGVLTADHVHQLGFRLPGEAGGYRKHTEAINVMPEVKVKVINEDFIRVVIDHSAGENAAQVKHGWPPGVRNALIVITAADGMTDVCHRFTTRLRNNIEVPKGSHGKQFIIKASFLRHISDEPLFGNEQTFSMPLSTEDLVIGERKYHEEFAAQARELERQRLEIERLQAELHSIKN